jgi:hypothetical protein
MLYTFHGSIRCTRNARREEQIPNSINAVNATTIYLWQPVKNNAWQIILKNTDSAYFLCL